MKEVIKKVLTDDKARNKALLGTVVLGAVVGLPWY